MKLLLTADVHIGRTPSRLPYARAREFSCSKTWEKLIRTAVAEDVCAVIVAGDLVDAANRMLEAAGALENGLHRLQEAGIELILTAGNHDVMVIPELSRIFSFPNLRIAGADGKWEKIILSDDDSGETLQLVGWSFPRRSQETRPLAQFPVDQVEKDRFCLGVMHSDYGSPGSPYYGSAPADFSGLPVDVWVLGHLHKPTLTSLGDGAQILIPGSPQGMDPGPGETGIHGPWLLETGQPSGSEKLTAEAGVFKVGRGAYLRHLPLAGLCYENLDLELSPDMELTALPRWVREKLDDQVSGILARHPDVRALSVRLTLTGRTDLSSRGIRHQLATLSESPFEVRGVEVDVGGFDVDIQPHLDLTAAAGQEGIVGLLGRAATGALSAGEQAVLMRSYTSRARKIINDRCFSPLLEEGSAGFEEPDPRSIRKWAELLLEEIVGTR